MKSCMFCLQGYIMSRVNIFVVLFFEKYVWECLKNFELYDYIK